MCAVLLRKQSIVAPRSSFRLTNKSELRILEAVRANASFSLVVFVKVVVLEVTHTDAIKSLENILNNNNNNFITRKYTQCFEKRKIDI